MSELLKPGERERDEIIAYIQVLLDYLNDFISKHRSELIKLGVMSRLLKNISFISMHKYSPEIYIREYWDEIVSIMDTLKKDPQLEKEIVEMNDILEKISELRKSLLQ
ncbi:hypothetical protein SUSAZ_01800 [Sulfolobus acidocaldarius SUSAZ]|nr:hypothetical protein SUSAZ_01800 [Sulfolobus acidocaldarius SUSAZ]